MGYGGAPEKYDPSYCDIALEHFKGGKSMVQLAARLMVTRQTLYNWASEHKEFFDTLAKGQELSQAWWVNLSQAKTLGQDINGLKMKNVSENGIIFNLRGRFHKDWSPKESTINADVDQIKIVIDSQDADL